MRVLILLPTYNEADNVEPMLRALMEDTRADVLVIDDSSPDGTADIARCFAENEPRVHLLVREKKEGLGRAYMAGFHRALDDGYDGVLLMDCDFSHDPKVVEELIALGGEHDLAIGSRYVPGGGTPDWSALRRAISSLANAYARVVLGGTLRDWTGGFKFISARALRGVDLDRIEADGYGFHIELSWTLLRAGARATELPITFIDRRVGNSKFSLGIMVEAFLLVLDLLLAGILLSGPPSIKARDEPARS